MSEDFDRDSWRTPPEVFRWLSSMFHFPVDLAADYSNCLCANHYSKEEDSLRGGALEADWAGEFPCEAGFCNPPYSNPKPWVMKAAEEAAKGFTTVMLLPSPNGEEYHRIAMENADELIIIHGRLAFLKPDGTPVSGNTRGSCVYVFRPHAHTCASEIRLRHVSRDWIFETYGESKESAA